MPLTTFPKTTCLLSSHKQTEKKSKPSYQRTNSQTFKMFDEAQIKEFKEIFGSLDFQMLLQLFGEKMSGTDPEETIMAGWHLFDPSASGEMGVDAVKSLLCNRGVKADRLTEAEVAQMFDQVKPAGGKFNYGKFPRIMKRGSDE